MLSMLVPLATLMSLEFIERRCCDLIADESLDVAWRLKAEREGRSIMKERRERRWWRRRLLE